MLEACGVGWGEVGLLDASETPIIEVTTDAVSWRIGA